ncbi:hypothetical protein CYLTODRAFT_491874 [Cylindrobasidium torrendii FP15055 ss-10]|uniref:Uncharacterized protein n=1 Tax=Cylindrobasidium torrendii FP15055 ss-10 TaxID=1314674 RepID=A0A0D7B716_9AGAR|nr:hypothetical protein CYLTODRAFT_491874 [Cylindrobasidium torrendii FP15055 ss-10]
MSTITVNLTETLPVSGPSQPSILRRRRRDSIEFIDVDSWEPEPPASRPVERAPPNPDVIELLDSDEEGDMRPRQRRRLMSPPAPAPEVQIVPPVPRLHNGALRPFNPVLANDQPFDFEDRFRLQRAAPAAARPPPPRRLPNISLGGALVSDWHTAAQERQAERERIAHQAAQSGVRRRRRPVVQRFGGTRIMINGVDEALFDVQEYIGGLVNQYGGGYQNFMFGGGVRDQIHYKPEFTHPNPPAPGFTFDFAPTPASISISAQNPIVLNESGAANEPIVIYDDEETPVASTSAGAGPSNVPSEPSVSLVCAHCNDKLLMGINGDAETERRYRVWALRCGHMLDGKCMDALSFPSVDDEPSDSVQDEVVVDRKGKGKAVARRSSRWRASNPAATLAGFFFQGKGKESNDVHEWHCPVGDCGHKHRSVKKEGKWAPDKEGMGAIAVYV